MFLNTTINRIYYEGFGSYYSGSTYHGSKCSLLPENKATLFNDEPRSLIHRRQAISNSCVQISRSNVLRPRRASSLRNIYHMSTSFKRKEEERGIIYATI